MEINNTNLIGSHSFVNADYLISRRAMSEKPVHFRSTALRVSHWLWHGYWTIMRKTLWNLTLPKVQRKMTNTISFRHVGGGN